MHETYASPGPMTGDYQGLLAELTSSVAELTAVGHGLLVHEHIAGAYGVTLSDADRETVHIRPLPRLLSRVVAVSDEPLTTPRPPDRRVAANCRHFTVLLVATLRARGVPARARCGFGGYFTPGFYEDHWVCEYWTGSRWCLVDGQIDDTQMSMFPVDFDVVDVPRDRFLVAGEAWQRYRRGDLPETAFGLSVTKESGAWWIAGNLMRDAAALGKVEMLPWDVWGVMPGPSDTVSEELAGLFDRLAAVTLEPEVAGLGELMADERIRVPATVLNAVLGREEVVVG
jgi:hypothetical protein